MRFLQKMFGFAVVVSLVCAIGYFVVIPTFVAVQTADEIYLTSDEIEKGLDISPRCFSSDYGETAFVNDEPVTKVKLKLFGFIPIKSVVATPMQHDELISGGNVIGFSAKTDGVVVVKDQRVAGKKYKRGDIIHDRVKGLLVKDDTNGVGTVTYINPKDNSFCALGHKLVDFETGASVNLRSGDVYGCNILGVDKSDGKHVGTIECTLRKSDGKIGSVTTSNDRGVYGELQNNNTGKKYPVGSRYSVKLGKASIYCSLDGLDPQEYEIEIIRAKNQSKNAGKGLVVKITDQRLLEKTGGIVHGMSGSPIIQNGKIIGALTHVMKSDVKRGYGVYIDWLI